MVTFHPSHRHQSRSLLVTLGSFLIYVVGQQEAIPRPWHSQRAKHIVALYDRCDWPASGVPWPILLHVGTSLVRRRHCLLALRLLGVVYV